jgi:hypothetical protein
MISQGQDRDGAWLLVTCEGAGGGDGCAEHVAVRPGPDMTLDGLVDVLVQELAAADWFNIDEQDLCGACAFSGAGQGRL